MELRDFAALSFDCYGTLIDWEAGILATLEPWAQQQDLGPGGQGLGGQGLNGEALLLAYADHEAAVEAEQPTWRYHRCSRRPFVARH
ncbi:MAG: hypothetical protein ACKN9D_14200 [Actinomycetales bacterium]